MTRALTLTIGSRTTAVGVEDDGTVTVGRQRFRVEPVGAGFYRVSDDTRNWIVAVAGPREDRWVGVDGLAARCELAADADRPTRRRTGADDLMAPMPATVIKVAAVLGTTVKAGDVLVVLEAMKMELAVRAPRAGVVRAIHCDIGELVQPGVPLLEID